MKISVIFAFYKTLQFVKRKDVKDVNTLRIFFLNRKKAIFSICSSLSTKLPAN